MIEIRIHGRGGQGNVVAAYLLATAAIDEGHHAQAFPTFGAERRGAPVAAFVRLAPEPILRRCEVREPHFVIVQDPTLLKSAGVTAGLREGGRVLVNSTRSAEELTERLGAETFPLPASQLAREHLGRPVPNTALLAAFLALTAVLPVEALLKALRDRFRGEVLTRNEALVQAAAGTVPRGLWKEVIDAAGA
jgi:pyruvate ferredoxin oxidoreductase gamma subunit